MLQILKQKITNTNQEMKLISIKLDDLANYNLILRPNLFSEIMANDFIKMICKYIVLDDDILMIDGENIPYDKVLDFLLN
jgi:hypothetical protein